MKQINSKGIILKFTYVLEVGNILLSSLNAFKKTIMEIRKSVELTYNICV